MTLDQWNQIISCVSQENQTLGAILKSCIFKKENHETWVSVYYDFHLKTLQQLKTQKLLQAACQQELGQSFEIAFRLDKDDTLTRLASEVLI